ncbi:uncharacterized protein LOC144296130 [Canis aureus]
MIVPGSEILSRPAPVASGDLESSSSEAKGERKGPCVCSSKSLRMKKLRTRPQVKDLAELRTLPTAYSWEVMQLGFAGWRFNSRAHDSASRVSTTSSCGMLLSIKPVPTGEQEKPGDMWLLFNPYHVTLWLVEITCGL